MFYLVAVFQISHPVRNDFLLGYAYPVWKFTNHKNAWTSLPRCPHDHFHPGKQTVTTLHIARMGRAEETEAVYATRKAWVGGGQGLFAGSGSGGRSFHANSGSLIKLEKA
jgi:hypothetical protein